MIYISLTSLTICIALFARYAIKRDFVKINKKNK